MRSANEKNSLFRILCVEDDEDSCNLLDFMLRQENADYVVTSAQTAEEAIDLMEKQSFDFYILDFWLPGMSGVELCRKIRAAHSRTPVIFYTATARSADRAVGIAAGADEYPVKSGDLPNLTRTVRRLLSGSKTVFAPSRVARDTLW